MTPTPPTTTPATTTDRDGNPPGGAPLDRTVLTVRRLWAAAGVVSLVALVVTAVLSVVAPAEANWVMWLRGVVITVACFAFARYAGALARGSRAAYVRMRLVATLAPIGVVLLVAAPDDGYPGWMKAEQAVLGVLVAVVAVLLWQRATRAAFPRGERAGRAA
ncbi:MULTISPECIES: hypothetical protein [unclassified Isoptericola]|uniref:hypothetical protein n=1 Tax=unclassified Isoptericola TaxID=2623355 RepID=UPI00364DFD5D